ncbi:hypothetical protein HC752_09330 [Vibrio sp. S9_S30]|uniref:hypothetical protein n=1 Tax=Vibrio sp. S9_S30 TaxID=2720226 RepID=UPI00167FFD3C|nr:hypothetical protein [Vibrio sp. S9_S30]MBD1557141.1 hypothetical protein [Vibrio sp. S9_S30]
MKFNTLLLLTFLLSMSSCTTEGELLTFDDIQGGWLLERSDGKAFSSHFTVVGNGIYQAGFNGDVTIREGTMFSTIVDSTTSENQDTYEFKKSSKNTLIGNQRRLFFGSRFDREIIAYGGLGEKVTQETISKNWIAWYENYSLSLNIYGEFEDIKVNELGCYLHGKITHKFKNVFDLEIHMHSCSTDAYNGSLKGYASYFSKSDLLTIPSTKDKRERLIFSVYEHSNQDLANIDFINIASRIVFYFSPENVH